jgi:hypothetical protein
MDNPAKDNLLRSWKEIAVHLGVDERTCARWEQKLGMPIHRAEEGMARSRVFAYKDELDRWFKDTFAASNGLAEPETLVEKNWTRRPVFKAVLIGFLVIVLAAAYFVIRGMIPGNEPAGPPADQAADFHIRGSTLVLLTEDGLVLGRFDTKVEGLENEDFYRTYFQAVDSAKSQNRLPSLVIRDINADGRNEVLFAVHRRSDTYGEGLLYCLDGRGNVLWRYPTGREMRFAGKVYSGDYRIQGFATQDLDGDGREEVVVIAHHYPQWPCQLSVLTDRGERTGEYWNSGQLKDVCTADLDGDGRLEMIVAGINNQYGPCLLVFDPARVSGCSPQSGEFKSDELPPGSELYYVVAPRTDVSRSLGDIVEGFLQVGITKNEQVFAVTQYNLGFAFDFGLHCLNVDIGHEYIIRRNELAEAGRVRSAIDEDYRKSLVTGVRYWDGERFVPGPTPNLRNIPKPK